MSAATRPATAVRRRAHGGVVAAGAFVEHAVGFAVGAVELGEGGVGLGGARARVDPEHLEVGERGADLVLGDRPGCSSWRTIGTTSEISQRCSPWTRSIRQMSGG